MSFNVYNAGIFGSGGALWRVIARVAIGTNIRAKSLASGVNTEADVELGESMSVVVKNAMTVKMGRNSDTTANVGIRKRHVRSASISSGLNNLS